MKGTLACVFIVFLVLLASTVLARRRPCLTDAECKIDECCVPSMTGDGKLCRDKGDDIGDACGGDHFCPCEFPLFCEFVNVSATMTTAATCRPANGTCQPQIVEPNLMPSTDSTLEVLSGAVNSTIDKM